MIWHLNNIFFRPRNKIRPCLLRSANISGPLRARVGGRGHTATSPRHGQWLLTSARRVAKASFVAAAGRLHTRAVKKTREAIEVAFALAWIAKIDGC